MFDKPIYYCPACNLRFRLKNKRICTNCSGRLELLTYASKRENKARIEMRELDRLFNMKSAVE